MSKAAATRLSILQKAFELIYTNGFQATSIDDIIAHTHVTKGAFYHHFKNKEEMGLAVIQEVMQPSMHQAFVQPIMDSVDPLKDIYHTTELLLFGIPSLLAQYGCPAGNLIQEMAPISPSFKEALSQLSIQWTETLVKCLEKGKELGVVKPETNSLQAAYFIISGYWGVRNLGKLQNSEECYHAYLQELKAYLERL